MRALTRNNPSNTLSQCATKHRTPSCSGHSSVKEVTKGPLSLLVSRVPLSEELVGDAAAGRRWLVEALPLCLHESYRGGGDAEPPAVVQDPNGL